IVHEHVVDQGREGAALAERDRDPFQSVRGLDAIAVAEATAAVLHVIQEDEVIRAADEVEVPLPRQVAGLDDRDAHDAGAPGWKHAESLPRPPRSPGDLALKNKALLYSQTRLGMHRSVRSGGRRAASSRASCRVR